MIANAINCLVTSFTEPMCEDEQLLRRAKNRETRCSTFICDEMRENRIGESLVGASGFILRVGPPMELYLSNCAIDRRFSGLLVSQIWG